jgi:hypothetical protein
MLRHRFPLSYELTPDTLQNGTQWLTVWLKNVGDYPLHNLNVKIHSTDSFQISFRNGSNFIMRINPSEFSYLSFETDVYGPAALYITITYYKEGGLFHWDSPWMRQKVRGEVAELESILVSNTYGTIGRELEVEATIQGLGNSNNGLDLEFGADTPSGNYEELAKIKTKILSPGEEVSYAAKITPKEEGFYTIYASLYDNFRRIGRDSDTLRVRK